MEDRKEKVDELTLPEALGAYALSDAARFHMPGHKGRGMGGFWRGDLVRWDVTELSCTDNLHRPEQAIKQAQRNMAEAYGAKASFLVVNGSTAAVQAMILSLTGRDRLLLCRDAHRCAVSGAALRGIAVEYMLPAYNETLGLWGMATPETLERELKRTHATAVLVTSPNYYGLCADIAGLSRVAHAHGALLLVDGAHGAHFPFSDALPAALGGYADVWAHSQHKTMDALTQAASLHLGACRIRPETLQRMLMLVETTSPSYLLMSSLDWSVYMAARQDWGGQVRRMDALRGKIAAIGGIALLPEDIGAGVHARDRTRLVLDVTGRKLTGYEAQALLERSGVFVEMADRERLVLITSPEDDAGWYVRLLTALATLPTGTRASGPHENAGEWAVCGRVPERMLSVRDAVFAAWERVPLAGAEGRAAVEPVGAYPPGIALAMPGEKFSGEMVRFLLREQEDGAALFGVQGGAVAVVKE